MLRKTRLTMILLFVVLLTGCQFPQIQPPRYGVVTESTIGWYNDPNWVGLELMNGDFVRVMEPCEQMDFGENYRGQYCQAEVEAYPASKTVSLIWIPEDKILFTHETGILTPEDDGYNIADFRVAMMSLSAEEAQSLIERGYHVLNGESNISAGVCIAIGADVENVTVPDEFYKHQLVEGATLICAPSIDDSSQDDYKYSVEGDHDDMHDELYFFAQ